MSIHSVAGGGGKETEPVMLTTQRRRRTDSWDGRNNLAQLELVKDGGLTCGIKADCIARGRERVWGVGGYDLKGKDRRRSNVFIFFLFRLS